VEMGWNHWDTFGLTVGLIVCSTILGLAARDGNHTLGAKIQTGVQNLGVNALNSLRQEIPFVYFV